MKIRLTSTHECRVVVVVVAAAVAFRLSATWVARREISVSRESPRVWPVALLLITLYSPLKGTMSSGTRKHMALCIIVMLLLFIIAIAVFCYLIVLLVLFSLMCYE